MDADLAADSASKGFPNPMVMKDLVDGLNGKPQAVLVKDLGAVRAGGQHGSDAVAGEPVEHLAKNTLKIRCSAEIMGGLRAAVQHKPERWYDSTELSVHLQGDRRPGTGKRTSRKENRVTSLRQSVPRKQGRTAARFIADYGAVGCSVKVSVFYVSTPHLNKQPAWIELVWTNCRAQSTEAAFVSNFLVQWRGTIESCCNGPGGAMPR